MTKSNLATLAEIAAVASSGAPVQDRLCEVIERLRAVIPIAGAAASGVDPTTGHPMMVVNAGYPDEVAEHVSGSDYHDEVVAPWALPRQGWPVRGRDLGVDPLTLRCNVEYFRPVGLMEGLVSALVTPDGRFVGSLDLGVCDDRHPTDEACDLVGRLAPMLANLVDPLQSAAGLAVLLGGRDATALGILGDGRTVALCGDPSEELLQIGGAVGQAVLDSGMGAFLWPRSAGGWYGCHVVRCRDGVAVLVVDDAPCVHGLTPREVEVLTCLAEGATNTEIGRRLWIAERTALGHVEHILSKLGVSSRTAAAARAVREGLVLPPQNGRNGPMRSP
jgi:DNA-binding CsgD family transcriptional regulator